MLSDAIKRRLYWLHLNDEEAQAIEHRIWQVLNTTLLVGGDIAVIRPEGAGNNRMTVLDIGDLARQIRGAANHENTTNLPE